jgi:hypothetical protein
MAAHISGPHLQERDSGGEVTGISPAIGGRKEKAPEWRRLRSDAGLGGQVAALVGLPVSVR